MENELHWCSDRFSTLPKPMNTVAQLDPFLELEFMVVVGANPNLNDEATDIVG